MADELTEKIIGAAIVSFGELFIIAYFAGIEDIWVSAYTTIPSASFCALMVIAYYFHHEELKNRRALNWSVLLLSATLFFLMVEASIV